MTQLLRQQRLPQPHRLLPRLASPGLVIVVGLVLVSSIVVGATFAARLDGGVRSLRSGEPGRLSRPMQAKAVKNIR
jgi:hypothetical protein